MTATADARSVVQSFYARLADGKPEAAFTLLSGDIEWNEAEGNPLADRNPYRGAGQIAEGVFGRLGAIVEGFAAVPGEFIAENGRVIVIALMVGRRRQDRPLPAVRRHRPTRASRLTAPAPPGAAASPGHRLCAWAKCGSSRRS